MIFFDEVFTYIYSTNILVFLLPKMKSTKKEESWKEFAREDKVQSGFYKYALGSYTYSLADAIADIIDNSITYGSKTVIVKYGFPKNKRPYIAIINDGDGMDETEIGLAMKIGLTKSRKGNDLGFFGTGLKAASLSQCKRFTVYSNKNGRTRYLCNLKKYFKSWLLSVLNI